MKRFFKILGILIILLVAAAIVLPVIFKGEITDRAKAEINNNVNATVNFEDLSVSLFSTFPHFLVGLDDLTVDGKGEFAGVRLAELGAFDMELDLWSVLFGTTFEVRSIDLKDVNVHIIINEEGKANYDITQGGASAEGDTTPTDTASGSFKISLQRYSLENFNLIYDDRQGEIKAVIKSLNHNGSGDFTQNIVDLKTETSIAELTVENAGIAYLNRVKVQSDLDLTFDQQAFSFEFGDNHIDLNDLVLNFTGSLAMPGDAIEMNLQFNSPQNSFKSLISLIPALYYQDFSALEASGDFALDGSLSGSYQGEPEIYPSFDLNLAIDNGEFHYPDLPAGVKNVMVKLNVKNTSNQLDATVIDLSKAKATIAGNPIEASFNLQNPISDPRFASSVHGKFDLGSIANIVPATGYQYSGIVSADFDLGGIMSDIENERYEKVNAAGNIKAQNIVIKSDSLAYDISISTAELFLSPQLARLESFSATVGESDFQANGSLDNLIGYALNDEVLTGDFVLTSSMINLNELSGPSAPSEDTPESTADTAALAAVRLPQNINFGLKAQVAKLLYDNLVIEDIQGSLRMEEGKASMENVNMNLLGGTVALNGSYNSLPDTPEVDMNFKINNFSFQESYAKFNTVQQMAPIMKNTTGNYSTGFAFTSQLNPDISPDLSTVNAKGRLSTTKLETNSKVLDKLASAVKNPSLSTLKLGAVDLNFKIENGRLSVEPFQFKAGNISATVQGSNGLDQSLDYTMKMDIPVSGIGASDLLGKIGAASGGKVDLGVNIGGTVSDPKITTSLGDLAKNVMDNLKNQAKEKIEEVKQEAKDKVNEEAQKLVAEAEKKGDQLIAEAQKQADQIRASAAQQAQKIRDEADKQAKKLEQEAAGNPLKAAAAKNAAEKIRSEANKKADKVEQEADKKAQQLVDEAKKKKQQLIDEAREKAKVE